MNKKDKTMNAFQEKSLGELKTEQKQFQASMSMLRKNKNTYNIAMMIMNLEFTNTERQNHFQIEYLN